ncbi:recombinase family protein [Kyrpidia sp.]|uniref:recombinase family protein n=1 Tax=Kyrpidia sp. TaxID=2073077 RepID=UPI0025866F71|nr:recombinase family protein [Kyrpidia sp.]
MKVLVEPPKSWELPRRPKAEGKIRVERTPGGHRRYDLASLRGWARKKPEPKERITLAYARVSTHDQKGDLERQVELLETFCARKSAMPR